MGINSDETISLNSGRITKNSGGKLVEETNGHPMTYDDGASTEGPMSFGDIVLEDTDIADLLLRADSDASFTVS